MYTRHYTSIDESKKLLSLGLKAESADICYVINYAESNKFGKDQYELNVDTYGLLVIERDNIPCWSLAALLGVLPEIQGGKPIISLDDNYITYPHMSDLHTKADNLIDACYEMIIKLHELKML